MGRAFVVSLAIHGGLLALALIVFAVRPDLASQLQDQVIKVVYLQQPGPGGGGGGSQSPAPPKKMEVPKAKAPDPVTPPTVIPPPDVIPPPLLAPIMTNANALAQATGASSVSLAAYGGGGRGTGLGAGTGNGVGPGTGGGFGGGAYHPGSGISAPTVLKQVKPAFTTEAMRAKIQGTVKLEVVILANGTVGPVRITKSLDKAYGLDEEAIKAAKQWLFNPGRDRDGKAVDVIVEMQLDFTLH